MKLVSLLSQIVRVSFLLGLSLAFALPTHAARPTETPRVCAAIRGNGELIAAHWAALARVIEEEGLLDAGAGGSSASITLFLYESLAMNPQLTTCKAGEVDSCSPRELKLRAALLMKSVFAYLDVLRTDADLQTVFGLVSAAQSGSIDLTAPSPELKKQVHDVLTRPGIRALVNPEFMAFITLPGPSLEFRIREAAIALQSSGNFKMEGKASLFRPGPVSFQEAAVRMGRLGDFLAGRGDAYSEKAMQAFLDRCAPLSANRSWSELAAYQIKSGTPTAKTCLAEAVGMMTAYRNRTRTPRLPSRLEDPVGGRGADRFQALVSLAVIDNPQAVRTLRQEKKKYWTQVGYQAERPLDLYDAVQYGYIGNARDLEKATRKSAYADLKTQKSKAYAGMNWKEALLRSPAEPGLSAIMDGPGPQAMSAAGWTDLSPVQALKNLGCERVIYITRKGQESPFALGVAQAFGATEAQVRALSDLKDPGSSLGLALREADRVYCTDWNNQADPDFAKKIQKLEADAYHSDRLRPNSRRLVGCGG